MSDRTTWNIKPNVKLDAKPVIELSQDFHYSSAF